MYKAVHRVKGNVSAIKKLEVAPSNLKEILQEIKMLKELGDSPYTIEYYGSYYKEGYLWVCCVVLMIADIFRSLWSFLMLVQLVIF